MLFRTFYSHSTALKLMRIRICHECFEPKYARESLTLWTELDYNPCLHCDPLHLKLFSSCACNVSPEWYLSVRQDMGQCQHAFCWSGSLAVENVGSRIILTYRYPYGPPFVSRFRGFPLKLLIVQEFCVRSTNC